nr:uncharacterized protein LOC115265199 [Aedes albopictus]
MTRENGEELRKLIEGCSKHVDALKNLQLPVEGLGEMILINTLAKRLDKVTRTLWESQLDQEERPSFSEMMDFLRERCRILQKVKGYPDHRVPATTTKPKGKLEQRNLPAKNFVQVAQERCPCCGSDHAIYKCEEFRRMCVSDRYNKVKTGGLCFNCLRRGHRTVDCKSEQSCKTCRRKHHSLLHEDKAMAKKEPPTQAPTVAATGDGQSTDQPQGSVNCSQVLTVKKQVLLSTASVLVCGSGGFKVACRVLLDSGSDSNIMSEELAKCLKLSWERIDLPISGLNNAKTQVKYKLRTKIFSRVNQFSAVLDFLVVPKVTANLPMVEVDIRSWPIPGGLSLADPSFHVPNEVQLILGAELFYDLLLEGRMKISDECPTLVETRLGWIVSGSVYTSSNKRQHNVCHLAVTNEDLNRTLSKFWELEACGEASPLTAQEHSVEMHFQQTVSRDDEGRYTVRLPFNNLKDQLGDSYDTARRRFEKLLRTFVDDTKKTRYTAFMLEYLTLGHMVKKSPLTMNQFVSNRVATIIELTQDYEWRYVRSEYNPADRISRGLMPDALNEDVLWWKGSPMLNEMELQTDKYDDTIELPEQRKTTAVNTMTSVPTINLNRMSDFRRLQRAWVFVLRFIASCRSKTRNTSEPTAKEMDEALRTIVKLVQQEAFADLFKMLSSDSQKRSNYSGLSPFVDSDGLIRVGGRLKYSSIPYDGKCGILHYGSGCFRNRLECSICGVASQQH